MSGDPGKRLPVMLAAGPALCDVLAECQRQQQGEAYLAAHDDAHQAGELARAAVAHVISALDCAVWAIEFWWPKGWAPIKRKGPRADLVRAAALLIAEIERRDRIAEPGGT
ncbi:MAG TPA: hypothetical protein VGF07_13235 [Stellaceae bacterium]